MNLFSTSIAEELPTNIKIEEWSDKFLLNPHKTQEHDQPFLHPLRPSLGNLLAAQLKSARSSGRVKAPAVSPWKEASRYDLTSNDRGLFLD